MSGGSDGTLGKSSTLGTPRKLEKKDMKAVSEVMTPDKLREELSRFGQCKELQINKATGSWQFDFKPRQRFNPDGVEYRIIVPASQFRKRMITEPGLHGTRTEFHGRSVGDRWAERREISVVLLTRGDAKQVPNKDRSIIEEYITGYARKGAKQGIELEFFHQDFANLAPESKHLVIDRAYTNDVPGMTEAFMLMREHSLPAVETLQTLIGQVADRVDILYTEAKEKGFALDWSGFTPGIATPTKAPHRTFEFEKDAPRVPEDVSGIFRYIEALNHMLSGLMVDYVDTLLSKATKSQADRDVQSALQQIAKQFNYSGPHAARNMIADFGWNMWQTRAFHFSISLPQDRNGLVSGALVKNEGNLSRHFKDLLAALNLSGGMAFGARVTFDKGKEEVEVQGSREVFNKTLVTSNAPQATAPDREQFELQCGVCSNAGSNQLDRSGAEIPITINGKKVIVGPMHSIFRPRVSTDVDTFLDFLSERQAVWAAGLPPDAVREVKLETPVRFEDTSPSATPELFRANLFRIALQHILHQAALIATAEGKTDIYQWLEDNGVLRGTTGEDLYELHMPEEGLETQMDALRGKLDTNRIDELAILIGLVKGRIGRYLEQGKTVEETPHLKQIFDYAELGIQTLRKVEREMHSERAKFLEEMKVVEEAYATRPEIKGRPRKYRQSPGAVFYRWYRQHPRPASYSNLLTNTQMAAILLDVFKVKGHVKFEIPGGDPVEFELDDKIYELLDVPENDFDKSNANRAVLLTLLGHYHVERDKERVRREQEKAAQSG